MRASRPARFPWQKTPFPLLILAAAVLCMHAPLQSQQWEKFVIDDKMQAPVVPRAADLDGDGDQDVVVSDWPLGKVLWYENTGDARRWSGHIIEPGMSSPMGVAIGDLDGDAALDVAVAGYFHPALSWHENDLPAGTWPRSTIILREDNADGASWIDIGDIDGDGDPDILLTAHLSNVLMWFENIGGTRPMWFRRYIREGEGIALGQVALRDIDRDGDLDVVAAIMSKDKLVWLESQQHGTRWVEHIIDPNLPVARCLSVDDIDGDGRLDVVAGGARGQAVVLYEQIGTGSILWKKCIIDSLLDIPGMVGILEIDGSPKKEIVATSYNEGIVVWYRETCYTWVREYVDSDLKSARGFCITDIDGDANGEILVVAQEGTGALVYYRNRSLVPHIGYSPPVLDFGKVMAGSTVRLTFDIENTGTGSLKVDSLEILGYGTVALRVENPESFRLSTGERKSISILCTPSEKGRTKKALRILSNDPLKSVVNLDLIVDAVADSVPVIRCSSSAMDFGDAKIDSPVERKLRVSNFGTGRLCVDRLELRGQQPLPFSIERPVPFTLDPREGIDLTVYCTPAHAGEVRDTLFIGSSAPASPNAIVPLTVNGVVGLNPRITTETFTFHFGMLYADTAVQRTVELMNVGDAPLVVDHIRIISAAPCPFCCRTELPVRIEPGGTAPVTIECMPTKDGVRSGVLQISSSDPSQPAFCINLIIDAISEETAVPEPSSLRLSQNYPNPCSPRSEIVYELPSPGGVRLCIYDLYGREVRTLVSAIQDAGSHRVDFDGTGLPPGVYVYRLQWKAQVLTRKMVLLE